MVMDLVVAPNKVDPNKAGRYEAAAWCYEDCLKVLGCGAFHIWFFAWSILGQSLWDLWFSWLEVFVTSAAPVHILQRQKPQRESTDGSESFVVRDKMEKNMENI